MADKLKKPRSLDGVADEHYAIGHAYKTAYERGDVGTVKSLHDSEYGVGRQESQYIVDATIARHNKSDRAKFVKRHGAQSK